MKRQTPARYASRPFPRTRQAPRLLILMAIALLLSALVSGCGFQLRGAANLPEEMSTTWVSIPDSTSAFARELDGEGPQGLADVQAGTRALRASLAVLAAVRDARPVEPSRLQVEAMPT